MSSKKLVDNPKEVVADLIEGLVSAYPGLNRVANENVIVRSDLSAHLQSGKVSLICGGGSGHEPAHAGFVGDGMLTGAILGGVFASPSVDTILAGIRAVTGPAGTLVIVKNYTGDRFNFGLAMDIARADGLKVELVVVADDVALSKDGDHAGRRGLAGTILVQKIAGAAAARGDDLQSVAAIAAKASDNVRTMGVGLSPCVIPAVGKPGFTLGDDEIEFGLGIHGEAGVRKSTMRPASEIVNEILEFITNDFKRDSIALSEVALMVNNLGGTSNMEMAVVAKDAIARLESSGIPVVRTCVGTFMSAMEMAGMSLSVIPVDSDTGALLDAATTAAAWVPCSPRPASKEPVIVEGKTDNVERGIPDGASPLPWLTAVLPKVMTAIASDCDRLTELDAIVGDGDLGISLARGVDAFNAASSANDVPSHNLVSSLRFIALLLQKHIGGSSGPLIAVFLLRAAAVVEAKSDAAPAKLFVDAFEAGMNGIAEMGRAKPGDRTMIDALHPALKAMQGAGADSLSAVLAAGVQGAKEGTDATKQMKPKLGRASYLGDRVLGHPDGGAELVTVVLRSLSDAA